MKTPFDKAKQMYLDNGYTDKEFKEDVELHARTGYVHISPIEFALVRQVSKEWPSEIVCNGELEGELEACELTKPLNCWHIMLAIGNLADLLSRLPYHLPYVSIERKGAHKVYKTSVLVRTNNKINENTKTTTTTSSSPSSAKHGIRSSRKKEKSTHGREEAPRHSIDLNE